MAKRKKEPTRYTPFQNRQFVNALGIAVLLAVLIGHIGSYIFERVGLYLTTFNPVAVADLYGQSQYVRVDPLQNLPDEYLYALAGWQYIHGENPAVFNADQPPLGKYIIGLGEVLTGNEKITTPLFVVISLVLFYTLCWYVTRHVIASLVATVLFSFEKLLLVQMVFAPLLDIYQLAFLLLALLLLAVSVQKPLVLVGFMVTVGLIAGTKYFATSVVLLAAAYLTGIVLALFDWKAIGRKSKTTLLEKARSLPAAKFLLVTVLTTPFALITLLLIYAPAYFYGYTPRMIIGVQKYIYAFHHGKIHFSLTNLWQFLFLNRWYVPWEGLYKPSVDWQWAWPVITLGSLVFSILFLKKCYMNLPKVLMTPAERRTVVFIAWFICYSATLMMGHVVARYVLPLLPVMYLLTCLLLLRWIGQKRS